MQGSWWGQAQEDYLDQVAEEQDGQTTPAQLYSGLERKHERGGRKVLVGVFMCKLKVMGHYKGQTYQYDSS